MGTRLEARSCFGQCSPIVVTTEFGSKIGSKWMTKLEEELRFGEEMTEKSFGPLFAFIDYLYLMNP